MADIEQLWYTFSANGLAGTTRGSRYQVRAASPGLLNSNSERMIMLNRYLSYEVHPSLRNNVALTPGNLCFLITESGERVLAHKVYYTSEGNKRHPFIHLLAGLPANFTARDAILLWRSDFWQMMDVDIKKQGLQLPVLALENVKQQAGLEKFREVDTIHIQSLLPTLLYATLHLLLHLDSIPAQNIYIAAPTDEVAYFIMLLTHCLPIHAFANFTFSTYEYNNIIRNHSLLVGTCKADVEKPRTTTIRDLLPEQCYTQGLAFNSYTGRLSQFKPTPPIDDILDYVIRALAIQQPAEQAAFLADLDAIAYTQNVDTLLEAIRACQQLHPLSKPLSTENAVTIEEAPTRAAFTEILQDAHLIVEHLSQQAGRKALLELIIAEKAWFYTTLKPLLSHLLKESKHDTDLVKVFTQLIQDIMETAVLAVSDQQSGTFMLMFHLLETCAPPTSASEAWLAFFQYLRSTPEVSTWIKQHWNIHEALILTAIKVASTQESPHITFLLDVPWRHLGKFLVLPAPKKWRSQTIQTLVNGPYALPDTTIVQQLSQQYTEPLEALFYQLTLEASDLSLAVALFLHMAEGGYSNMALLYMLFDQNITQSDANKLLKVPGISPQQRSSLQRSYMHKWQAG